MAKSQAEKNAQIRAWRARMKEAGKIQHIWHKSHLKQKYGMTLEEYNSKREKQNNRCAICKGTSTHHLVVDHDHESGAIRDLLCSECNLGLGKFRDNALILEAALVYLNKHSKSESSIG